MIQKRDGWELRRCLIIANALIAASLWSRIFISVLIVENQFGEPAEKGHNIFNRLAFDPSWRALSLTHGPFFPKLHLSTINHQLP